jgi:GNAT superfamily N-acetyltransferase
MKEAGLIEIVSDPFPTDEAINALWLSAWKSKGPKSFAPVLGRSLAHVGAFDGDALVGFVNVAWDGGVHAFILDTTVHADYQRRGVGLLLLARAKDLAQQRGAHWLHVDFEPHLEDFYRRAGFAPSLAGVLRLT